MKRFAAVIAVPVLLFSLPACGSGPSPIASHAVASASSSASSAESASLSPLPSTPPAAAEASVPASGKKAAPLYRMNKNYDIVPIDPDSVSAKVVLLTFDDGPKAEATLKPILDTLDKHRAKAIFFVNGFRVQKHPGLLKEIDERGQTVGNHTWSHAMLGKEKPDKVREEIGKTQDIVKETIGKTPVFFRPPNASGNADTHAAVKEYGMLYMTWSVGSLDWEMSGDKIKDKTAAIVKNVSEQLHSGSNILMHELPWTGTALDALLTDLEKRGYSFVDPRSIDTATSK
ncbi:polysaccharide deacetylase family protein [Cohnella zeiphila]|uniref:Polysaccharide deacetylase family protein n=1 Tax=Cohnella zeiphila TaxID=2761120 RepID=A0A7X0W175_9BACL|nr:polysaccharide deacetylase family protein [Cohnella zeiphila]MBB6735788.1 polysaccharide deacetylase family protein [Cohnella zeiphila]